jgi:Homeodomain-like domain
MKNEFMIAMREAMYRLESAQRWHVAHRARLDRKLEAAQARHASEVSRLEMGEAECWAALLAVPGVTIPTAAALMQVSESTVSRWVARYNRGLDDIEAVTSGGGA